MQIFLPMSTKLSKRKQKALAFRGNKKSKVKDEGIDEEAKAIPQGFPDESTETNSWLGNDNAKSSSKNARKRKRQAEEPNVHTSDPSPHSEQQASPAQPTAKKPKVDKEEKQSQKRFIVFVGNLPYLPSPELQPALQSHFPSPPISIRIPTKKGTNDPQGFAFLEFDTPSALEKALRCHHTMLLKRKINVELTAGGGGKGASRLAKVKQKNEALAVERKQRIDEEKKNKAEKDEATEGIHPDRLKRMKGGT
jgi:nucleolar protein 6